MADAIVPEFHSPFLNTYLRMVEETESPRLMHVWGAIGSISAALGRRVWLPFGDGVTYANQYIVMVGTPGVRKSTVLRIAKKQLKKSTGVRFAPDDTAGNRQGLIKVMLRDSENPELYLNGVNLDKRDPTLASLTMEEFSQISTEAPDEETYEIDSADKQHLMATSDEFSRFIGQNSSQMLDFLTSLWDGLEYTYDTNQRSITLEKPLLNILGCTTPFSIANSMPSGAGGQGFLSRVIFVYGATKYKSVPRPPQFPDECVDSVRETLNHVYHNMHGPMEEEPEAAEYIDSLYEYALEISDSRFGYYHERRHTHLRKLAMCIAASRKSMAISTEDVSEAHRILRATERGMPDALGEFGMNPLAALKQSILEFMRDSLAMPLDELRAHFHRDSRSHEFIEVVNDLVRTKQLVLNQTSSGKAFVSARVAKADTEDSMFKLLAER